MVLALALYAGCNSQDDLLETPHGTVGQQSLADVESVHDLGIVDPGSINAHVFRLENTSGQHLSFDSFQKSCNCSGLAISKKQLRPGERFQVAVSFRAGHRSYDTAPTVLVLFRGEARWIVALRLFAKVRPALSLSVREIRWASVGNHGFPDATFFVRNYSDTHWPDISLRSSEPWVRLRTEPALPDEDALQMWKCIATPLPSRLSTGDRRASVEVRSEGGDATTSLPVTISIKEPVSLVPGHVFHVGSVDGALRVIDLRFVFCTGSPPTEPEAFSISASLGDVVRPEIVRGVDGNWLLRCYVRPSERVVRDQFYVHIPSVNASLRVPVLVTPAETTREM